MLEKSNREVKKAVELPPFYNAELRMQNEELVVAKQVRYAHNEICLRQMKSLRDEISFGYEILASPI